MAPGEEPLQNRLHVNADKRESSKIYHFFQLKVKVPQEGIVLGTDESLDFPVESLPRLEGRGGEGKNRPGTEDFRVHSRVRILFSGCFVNVKIPRHPGRGRTGGRI